MSKIDNDMGMAQKALARFQNAVGVGLKVATGVGVAAVGALGAAIGSGVHAAVDFESAFTGVVKTVDATEEELAELRKGILDMSSEVPASASSIASVAEAAGQLGIETANVLGFTRVMSDLGVATNMSSDDAATSLARLANITGMPQTQFDRLGSSVVALGNNLATTESEIVAMGLRIAGAGSQIGLSEAQILGLAGALSSVGIQAEAGGTAISTVMIDMASAVANGGEELENIAKVAGMSSSSFADSFRRDATGAIMSFIQGLDGISKAGGNVFGVLDELGMGDIRVRDTLLRASGASALFADAINISTQAWEENIALTQEAETRYNTVESRIQLFRNAIDALRIGIGDKFMPIVRDMIGTLTEMVKNVTPRVIEFFGGLADRLQQLIGGISAGTLAFEDGSGILMDFLQLLGLGEGIAQTFGKAFYDLRQVFRNVWGEVSGVFRGLGTDLGAFRDRFSLQLATLTSDNVSWGEKMAAVWHMVTTVGNKMWQTLITNLANLLPSWLEKLGEWATAAWEWLVSAIPTAIEKLGEWALALWNWIVENAPQWAEKLWEWAKATWQWIVDVTPDALAKLGEWAAALYGWLAENAPVWASNLAEWGAAAWQWIADTIPTVQQKLGEWGNSIWSWLRQNAPTWVQTLMDWGEAGWGFIQRVGEIIVAIGGIFQPVIDAIAKFVEWKDVIIAAALTLGVVFWPAISAAITAAIGAIGAFIAAWGPVVLLFAAILAAVVALRVAWENDWLGIRTAIETAWGVISYVFSQIWDRVGEIVERFKTQWQLLQDTNATLGEKLKLIWETIGEIASTVWNGIVQVVSILLPPFLAKMQEWGAAAWEWLSEAIPIALEKIGEWGASLLEWLGKKLPEWIATLFEWGTALYTWIGNVIPNAIDALTDFIKGVREQGEREGTPTFVKMVGEWATEFWKWITEDLIPKVGPEFTKFINVMGEYGAKLTVSIGNLAIELGKLLWQWIVTITPIAVEKLGVWGQALLDWIKNNLPMLEAKLIEWGTAAWNWIVEMTPIAVQKIGEWGTALWEWLTSNETTWIERLSAWGVAIWQWIQDALPQTTGKITEWYNAIVEWLGNLLDKAKEILGNVKAAVVDPVNEFVDSTKNTVSGWKDWLVQKWTDLKDGIKTQMDAFKAAVIDPVKNFISDTKDRIGTWRENIIGIYDMLKGNVLALMTTLKDNVVNPIKQFIQDTKDRVDEWRSFLTLKWEAVKDKAKEIMDKVKANVIDPVVEFINSTKDKIIGWKDWIVQKFTDIWDNVKSVLDVEKWKKWGRDLIDGFRDGLREKWNNLTEWFSGVWSDLVSRFKNFFGIHSPSTLFKGFGGDIMAGLRDGIDGSAYLVTGAMSSLSTSVTGTAANMVGQVGVYADQIKATLGSITFPTIPPVTAPTPAPAPAPAPTPAPPQGDDRDSIPAQGSEFGNKNLSAGLNSIAAFVDTTNAMLKITQFAGRARAFLTAPGQPSLQAGAARMALELLESEGASNASVDRVLAAIQTLVAKLDERGFGQQFNIQQAPDASLQQRQELQELVNYLNALYA